MPNDSAALHGLLVSWDAILFTVALAALVPFCSARLFSRWKRSGRSSKIAVFLSISLVQGLMVAFLVLVLRRHGLSPRDLGEGVGREGRFIAVTLSVLAVLLVGTVLKLRQLRAATPEEIAKALGPGRLFCPRTRAEIGAFLVLTLTAGICEELLYRGWLLLFLSSATGSVWVGLVASSLIFGLGHAYQGVKGVLATGAVGLVLGLVVLFVGGLGAAQVVHVLVNLVNGLAGAYVLEARNR
ncbi:MAG TPA: CPBP family intramembrane glutamic endopeptidase [Thermoanaerobaculia bacterium]|jgi:membrane protease YdiL (CAAX protease family)|nr:CPBP family intramembrane glutamic endopeptidase [Thermoanaerobaculia bacterium]